MRLAVLADIHGNLPALEAVLADLQQFPVHGILVAGDMVAGPNPVEVMQRLQQLNCWMVRGNNENYLLRFDSGDAPECWYTSRQWAFIRWNYEQTDKDTLETIRALPEQRVISLPGKDPIRVVHGSPRDSNEHLYPAYDDSLLKIALEDTSEPVLVCGHTHIPWQERRDGCLIFNPGAVSFPLNGEKGAQYVILDWQDGKWEVEFRSVDYELDLVQKAFAKSGLLKHGGAFTRCYLLDILHGTDITRKFLNHAYHMAAVAGYPDCEYVPNEVWDGAVETFDWEAKN